MSAQDEEEEGLEKETPERREACQTSSMTDPASETIHSQTAKEEEEAC
jgi:hypothetical protein